MCRPHRDNSPPKHYIGVAQATMSSEFDMSFEEFLNYDFDVDNTGSGLYSLDAQGQQDGNDYQMLGFPAGDFDTFDGEALDQPSTPVQPDWAPWAGDVAFSQLPELQDTALSLEEPGESA
jgi:hypothetical protein